MVCVRKADNTKEQYFNDYIFETPQETKLDDLEAKT